jgi:hypothetical protein
MLHLDKTRPEGPACNALEQLSDITAFCSPAKAEALLAAVSMEHAQHGGYG